MLDTSAVIPLSICEENQELHTSNGNQRSASDQRPTTYGTGEKAPFITVFIVSFSMYEEEENGRVTVKFDRADVITVVDEDDVANEEDTSW